MRKLNYILIALAIFSFSCENNFDEESKNQITLSSKTIEVHFESNEHTINVTSPYSWIAVSKNDWITLTCDNGIAGTEKLQFVCDRNIEETERKGTIVIKNEDFGLATELYVTQKPFIPELFVEQDRTLSFTEKGGSDIVRVSSNFNYSVSSSVSWINCTKTEDGVKVAVSASDVANERTSQITIYSEKYNISYEVKVIQEAFIPELSIDKEELYFDADGGSDLLNITTNAEYSISESADWITCSKSGNSVTITAYASTVTEERCADVIISSDRYDVSKVVKVRQSAFEPYISISATELIFDAKGGEQNVTISANCEYFYSTDVDWIKLPTKYPDILSTNYDSSSLTISVSANDNAETRNGEVTIYDTKYDISKTIQVRQYGIPNGFLSIADAVIIVRADEYSNILDYKCSIINEENEVVMSFKYADRPTEAVELETGDYIFKIQSGEVPGAAWESPVYGSTKPFKIVRNETTEISEIVCSLLQIQVSISYSQDLLERLGDKTLTTVKVGNNSLEYSLGETRSGFFLAPQLNNTIEISISGTYAADLVTAKPINMTKEIKNVTAGQYSKVHFYIEHSADGNINVSATIRDWVTDEIIPL